MSNKPKLKISINNYDDNKDNDEDIEKEEVEDNSNEKSESEDELLMKKVQDELLKHHEESNNIENEDLDKFQDFEEDSKDEL